MIVAVDAKTILVIEDDVDTRRLVSQALAGLGHRVLEAGGIAAGLSLFKAQRPDLVVLDVNLPDGSGVEACAGIRAHPERGNTPVIMLTAEGRLEAKEKGFAAGADQYLVKPLHLSEFLLWAGALLRRTEGGAASADALRAGELLVDPEARLVRWRGAALTDLTAREFDLFHALVRQRPKVLSRRYIMSSLWRTVAVDHLVDTHLRNLRNKLPPELAERVQSVPGKGFRFLD